AGRALLGVARRLGGRGREVGVAEATLAAAGDHRRLADHDQVGEQRPGLVLVGGRAGRDVEGQVATGRAGTLRALGAADAPRLEVVPEAKAAERRLADVDTEVDRSASAAVAAVG